MKLQFIQPRFREGYKTDTVANEGGCVGPGIEDIKDQFSKAKDPVKSSETTGELIEQQDDGNA